MSNLTYIGSHSSSKLFQFTPTFITDVSSKYIIITSLFVFMISLTYIIKVSGQVLSPEGLHSWQVNSLRKILYSDYVHVTYLQYLGLFKVGLYKRVWDTMYPVLIYLSKSILCSVWTRALDRSIKAQLLYNLSLRNSVTLSRIDAIASLHTYLYN